MSMYDQPTSYRNRRPLFSSGPSFGTQGFPPYNDPFRDQFRRDGFSDRSPFGDLFSEVSDGRPGPLPPSHYYVSQSFPQANGFGSFPPPGVMNTSYSMSNRPSPPFDPSGFEPTGPPPRAAAAYPDSYDNLPLSNYYFSPPIDDGFGARWRTHGGGGFGFGSPVQLPSASPMIPYPSHRTLLLHKLGENFTQLQSTINGLLNQPDFSSDNVLERLEDEETRRVDALAANTQTKTVNEPICAHCKRNNHQSDFCILPDGKMTSKSLDEARNAHRAAARKPPRETHTQASTPDSAQVAQNTTPAPAVNPATPATPLAPGSIVLNGKTYVLLPQTQVEPTHRASSVDPGIGLAGYVPDPHRRTGGIDVKFCLEGESRQGILLSEATDGARLSRSISYSMHDLAPDARGRITLKVMWAGFRSKMFGITVRKDDDGCVDLQSLARRIAKVVVDFMTSNHMALCSRFVVLHRLEEISSGVWIPVLTTH